MFVSILQQYIFYSHTTRKLNLKFSPLRQPLSISFYTTIFVQQLAIDKRKMKLTEKDWNGEILMKNTRLLKQYAISNTFTTTATTATALSWIGVIQNDFTNHIKIHKKPYELIIYTTLFALKLNHFIRHW